MLEGLVVWVLNNYLGKYVENLNTDQLSVALLSGKVELENLPLRKDALQHLGLPVEVKAGFIGKVQLQVPVRQIRSAPWILAIEKLYVVLAPINLDEWDSTVEANITHEHKMSILDAMEAQWRAEHEAQDGSYYATSYSSWLSYGTGLMANIVENLQLKLKDVHIRYEDSLTCAPCAFACGLTVAELAAESCDSDWKRGFMLCSETEGCSYKLLELSQLAVYWDRASPADLLAGCDLADLAVRMSGSYSGVVRHSFLVSPSTAVARVRRERCEQPLRLHTQPRLHCALTLDRVQLSLTQRQYCEAMQCCRGLSHTARLREVRSLRPAMAVAAAPRAWWLYALRCHKPHHNWMDPRPTWAECLERARRVRKYVAACVTQLAHPAGTLPADMRALKDDFEWNTQLHILKPLREIAMRQVPKLSPTTSNPSKAGGPGRSMLVHWFPQWWGWYGSPEPADTAPDPTPDLEGEILDVIADSIENNTLLKRDTVFGQFEFLLNNGCLNFSDVDPDDKEKTSPCLELQFSSVRVGVSSRPRASSHALTISVGDVLLRDRLTPHTLFPVLIAPQGMIREGLSAMNVTSAVMSWCREQGACSSLSAATEPLFQLTYEKKPFGLSCDYKLYVKSQSLEVVYNSDAVQWVASFLSQPWRSQPDPAPELPRELYASVRDSTRTRLMNHWEHILQGDLDERSSWHIELDISAPQILLVEEFTQRDAAVMLVDFGKMHLSNGVPEPEEQETMTNDEEMYLTPCSTPPGSLASPMSPLASPVSPPVPPTLDHAQLHKRLYDTYTIELSDLQILVGRARDNWKYAHTKTTSSLHLLDRFSISLQAERRMVATSDPQFPSAALCGTLPSLVAHLSEHKLAAVRSIVQRLSAPSPHEERPRAAPPPAPGLTHAQPTPQNDHQASTLFMLQFAIDQMSLEVQSRGRSIAEVQVCGVRAGLSRRPRDLALSLSVHSLLLVDALQTHGPDFELLVASHKHVGMDATSGAMCDSEPTSPASPSSPLPRPAPPFPAPAALASALGSLPPRGADTDKTSPGPQTNTWSSAWGTASAGPGWSVGWGAGLVDSEALIAVELCIVKAEGDSKEDLHIANILFNNLDIIANQETIVELIGFTQRVLGPQCPAKNVPPEANVDISGSLLNMPPAAEDAANHVRTEITFDFHRLGVLLLRAAVQDGNVVAKKIATVTLSEAKIQATLAMARVKVTGSLGGLQLVAQSAGAHRRLLAAGHTPPVPRPATRLAQALATHLYAAPDLVPHQKALTFTVARDIEPPTADRSSDVISVTVSVHLASVWYTHSAPVLAELQACLAQFQQYLANLARSIRAAAADMAMGLVLPQTRIEEGVSPRRRAGSLGASLDGDALADCLKSDRVLLSLNAELETPVVVVPRSASSTQVFVAHLGRMTLTHGPAAARRYQLRLRDISLYSLDVSSRLVGGGAPEDIQSLYSCIGLGKPVLHDTALFLQLEYMDLCDNTTLCDITGKIVDGLRVSATREQYEQLLETVRSLSVEKEGGEEVREEGTTGMEVGGAATLRLDPHVRAQAVVPPPEHSARPDHSAVKVNFNLPTFTVELRGDFGSGERSLVDLSFKDFNVNYEKIHPFETCVQVSLHSVTMEDLTQEVDSKHRMLMVSHTPQVPKAVFVSKSCPDFVSEYHHDLNNKWSKTSLPGKLNSVDAEEKAKENKCGPTPPCSPDYDEGSREDVGSDLSGDENLVWISVHMRDPQHPLFEEKFNKVAKFIKVDFNCLNLVVSIDSWVAVLDFFGVAADDGAEDEPPAQEAPAEPHATVAGGVAVEAGVCELDVSVRALSVVLVRARGEVCRVRAAGLMLSGAGHAGRPLRGRLAALALADLTPHAGRCRDRLATPPRGALTFHYERYSAAEAAQAGYTSSLHIESGGVRYVHTKRFVAELQAFFRDFSLLRKVLHEARRKVSVGVSGRARRQRLVLQCWAPVIVVPAGARSHLALEVQLDSLTADNRFLLASDPITRAACNDRDDPQLPPPLLDVRSVRLERASLWCTRTNNDGTTERLGPALLRDCSSLTLQVEHNMEDTHNVADITIHGSLESLDCSIDPAQYSLLRAVLVHNIGEDVTDLGLAQPMSHPAGVVWTLMSLQLDLQNVIVKLEPEHGVSSLACINFIKSRLLVETFSDLSQDIDLVSQEILVSDTRYQNLPANRRGNVFSHIVQPLREAHGGGVQAEVHARRRPTAAAYTVLVHSMRLLLVLDWWDQVNHFLGQPPSPSGAETTGAACDGELRSAAAAPIDLKLNITESQLVFVEDASIWDTNAVILKSTTVLSYRGEANKPVTCSLNNVEVFSCVLGLEDETALCMVAPAALHVELDADRVLHFQTSSLNLRLSYHDMRMLASMLQSLPAQARLAVSGSDTGPPPPPANIGSLPAPARRLAAMGFSTGDCAAALQACAGSVAEAALWLRTHAAPLGAPPRPAPRPARRALLPLASVQFRAECVSLCVIDDCLDSDVPLLELSLTDLSLEQDLRKAEEAFEDPMLVSTPTVGNAPTVVDSKSGPGGGRLSAALSADYYNRALSGWEPIIEPWKFRAAWEHRPQLQMEVSSDDMLSVTVTSSLVQLLSLVRTNWWQDYYAPQEPKSSPPPQRRRAPFVPYALRNLTGHTLWFTTFVTMADELTEECGVFSGGVDDSWPCVRAGDTEPFSFGARPRDPRRPRRQRLHQLAVCVDGWRPVGPVCVDRVGDYYRLAKHAQSGALARVVLAVSLEGAARKLVTVRSALRLRNMLPHALEVRSPAAGCLAAATLGMIQRREPTLCPFGSFSPFLAPPVPVSTMPMLLKLAQWGVRGRAAQIAAGATWAAPLAGSAGTLWLRPLAGPAAAFMFTSRALSCTDMADDRPQLTHLECSSPGDKVYRFCCVSVRERFPPAPGALAGHVLSLVPALRVESLLPLELQYRVQPAPPEPRTPTPPLAGTLPPGHIQPFHEVNMEEGVEISVKLEGFSWSTPLSVLPTATSSFSARLKLLDQRGRRLYLTARAHVRRDDGIKVSISAPYWVVNRSGVPLVFRAEGAASEAAGQGPEHEVARVVQPLPFAFPESEAGSTLQARLGLGLHDHAEWCSPFGLGPGVVVRRLEARGGTVHEVGVAVRAGRGRYRHTNIVTLCPRYQLHNNTAFTVHVAQKCMATTLNDPGAKATHLSAVAGCYLPWHWPRWDREQLLCLRVQDTGSAWSGGFRVDSARSLHVACRERDGVYQFVRVEVVSQAASLFIVLTDADTAPPPLRLLNYSAVAVMFHQVGCAEECVAGAHSAMSWTLPEPEAAAALSLRAPGGPRLTLRLEQLPHRHQLPYQNFIYIAFTTPATCNMNADKTSSAAPDDHLLVLEVPIGTTKVVLGKKRYGDRSQLWRRGPGQQLVHEGSSPPQPTDALRTDDTPLSTHAMVLDIEGPAPRPGALSALSLRRADPRRVSTQTWRRDPSGRMCCAHANLCLQPEGGLFGLRPGNRVVLGLPTTSGRSLSFVPPEQIVCWQRLRPGSGRLDVTVSADGPTRVIRINDHDTKEEGYMEGSAERGTTAAREWSLMVRLRGAGVSLVAGEELVHAVLGTLQVRAVRAPLATAITFSAHHMQWDNQLLGTPSPVLLYCLPDRTAGGTSTDLPALHVDLEITHSPTRRYNAMFFRHLVITLRPLAIRLEERLLLKLCLWAALPDDDQATEEPDEADFETHRMLSELTAVHAKRYYFGVIKIVPSLIRLSMCTASRLEPELAALKRRLAVPLVRFEDAAVELQPFSRNHHYDTAAYLGRALLKHFRDQLKWQAAKILGSVDFLGNPLGFVADVSEGVSGLIYEGSVGALLQNLTHGISNSAAKVTESLGDGLERVVVDEAHEETRRRIRSTGGEQSHLVAGVRGLGLGLLGGMTSLVKHSYEGAAQEGLAGFLAGIGKGLVGTVTKPVIGVLDLAAETASALRDTSRRCDKWVPSRVRGPRCAAGPGGLLPRYSQQQSAGAQYLYQINRHDYSESFLAYQLVRDTPHDIRALLSTQYLRIFTCKHAAPQIVLETHLSNLVSCVAVSSEHAHYVELGVRGGEAGGGAVRRPRVQCDTRELASWLARNAACAKQLYHDTMHTVRPSITSATH